MPSLAFSLLKPALRRSGVECDVRYFSVDFLERFVPGDDVLRQYIALIEKQHLAKACAAQFGRHKYRDDAVRDALLESYRAEASEQDRALLAKLSAAVDPFLDHCLRAVDWSRYPIVGFTTLFAGMTLPAAILAGYIKQRSPDTITVLGGWNTSGVMGEVLAAKFEEFDFILRGEADETFVSFVHALLERRSVEGTPGLVYRDRRSGGVVSWPQARVERMDELPLPDFDDWFAAMDQTRFARDARRGPSLPFESSRGCYWGEVSHCKFCGLNGLSMPFRSKSPERLLAELDLLVERYRPELLFATDTIFEPSYYAKLLPKLRNRYAGTRFAYEIKAPVRSEQMRLLAEARVEQVTVGIESLSTRILKLMHKGVSMLQNLHCLRLASEVGVEVGWQHLRGFPGETWSDYEPIAALMPRLSHLPPPSQSCPITVARFSPYFERAAENQIGRLRAHSMYRVTYPWSDSELSNVAYHFDFEHEDGRDPGLNDRIEAALEEGISAWRSAHASARLDLYAGRSLALIVDTRYATQVVFVLRGVAFAAYQAMAEITSERALGEVVLGGRGPELSSGLDAADAALLDAGELEAQAIGARMIVVPEILPPESTAEPEPGAASGALGLRAWLDALDAVGLIATEAGRYLALAVPRQSEPPAKPDVVRPERTAPRRRELDVVYAQPGAARSSAGN